MTTTPRINHYIELEPLHLREVLPENDISIKFKGSIVEFENKKYLELINEGNGKLIYIPVPLPDMVTLPRTVVEKILSAHKMAADWNYVLEAALKKPL